MKKRFKDYFLQAASPPRKSLLKTYESTLINMSKALTNHRRAFDLLFLQSR